MKKKIRATLIGLVFTVVSFLSIFTFIVPIVIVLPVALFFENILGPASYEKIGTTAIIVLSGIALSTLLGLFIYVFKLTKKGKEISISSIILFLFAFSFIIHPLGFYIYVSTNWRMANDGQFIFAILPPFGITSFSYFVIGLIIDLTRSLNRTQSLAS